MWQIFTSSNMGLLLTSYLTDNNYLKNAKVTSAICKNVIK